MSTLLYQKWEQEKERRAKVGLQKAAIVTWATFEDSNRPGGGLLAVNAIGTQMRDSINISFALIGWMLRRFIEV